MFIPESFTVFFLFCFLFFHQKVNKIRFIKRGWALSRSQNDKTSTICLLISVTATLSLKIVVEWRRSSFDLTTSLRLTFWHITKKREQILKRGPPIRTKPRRSLWLKFFTFVSAGNTDNGWFGRTLCIQREENTAIHRRIRQPFLYLISKKLIKKRTHNTVACRSFPKAMDFKNGS